MEEGRKLRLDLACGMVPKEGFEGVDRVRHPGVIWNNVDLLRFPFPWLDSSVSEIWCANFIEHIPMRDVTEEDLGAWGSGVRQDRIGQDMFFAFFDECHRILEPGGNMTVIWPALQSSRAFRDPTHRRFIPIETMNYLDAGWRRANNLSHYQVGCDFGSAVQSPTRQVYWNIDEEHRIALWARKGGK